MESKITILVPISPSLLKDFDRLCKDSKTDRCKKIKHMISLFVNSKQKVIATKNLSKERKTGASK